jgi:hypothetical protein
LSATDASSGVASSFYKFTPPGTQQTYSGSVTIPNSASETISYWSADKAGNTESTHTTSALKVDTVAPAAPTLTAMPPDPSSTSTSTFAWADSDATSGIDHFLCSVENGAFQTTVPSVGGSNQPCSSQLTYVVGVTNNGQHQFGVEAVDKAGNVGPATYYTWKVVKASPQLITVSGNADGSLFPGATRNIPVTFTNPNSTAITVTTFTITRSFPSGCNSADFTFSYGATPISAGNPLTVPANGSVTLNGSGNVSEPTLQMTNTGSPQDSCHGTITLTYAATDASGTDSGTATVVPSVPFGIAGNATGMLYPISSAAGATPIAITITNPNPFPIYVTSITVMVMNNPNGCLVSPNDVQIVPSSANSGSPITVPAGANNYVVPTTFRPAIWLKDTGADQTPHCKDQTFTLGYSGTAHS